MKKPSLPSKPIEPTKPDKTHLFESSTFPSVNLNYIGSRISFSEMFAAYEKAAKELGLPLEEISLKIDEDSSEYGCCGNSSNYYFFVGQKTVVNEKYDKQLEQYNKKMEAYTKKLAKYEEQMKAYNKELKEYNIASNAEEITRLEKRLKKLKSGKA